MDNLKQRLQDMDQEERRRFLENNADDVQEETNYVKLPEEKKQEIRQRFTEESIELKKKKEEYEDVKKRWKEEEINPRKKRVSTLLEQLEKGVKEFTGRTYYIRDFDKEKVYKFLYDGTLVDERDMWESEKQATVHSMQQRNTGTENQNR